MEPNNNVNGATEIFRMPSADTTSPDLSAAARVARPTLAIVKGPHTGQVFELSDTLITLGRDPSNTIFLNDMTVSRRHARIDLTSVSTGIATVEDLGSLNGTWVDGAIVNRAMLKDGSTIQVGTFRMVFHTNRKANPARIETGE